MKGRCVWASCWRGFPSACCRKRTPLDEHRSCLPSKAATDDLAGSGRPADRAAAVALLPTLLHELSRRRGGSWLEQQVRVYVDEHLARPFRVAEVAATLGLSPSRLLHRFRAEAGEPLMAWVRRRRMQRARELLHRPELTLADIAAQVGIAGASHLSHLFLRENGCRPATYRARLGLPQA